MEGTSSRGSVKRSFVEDVDESKKLPAQKRVRFPKGKKVRSGDEIVEKTDIEEDVDDLMNPCHAAKERANRRNQIAADLFSEDNRVIINDISTAEVKYEDNENFVDDGIQIEPFNLNKEREEGYFDANGNFVEYAREKEIQDAWLDNIEVDPKFAGLSSVIINDEEEIEDLSSKDIGIIKRRIANVLKPGETVLQALKRLKGSSDRKAKMSADTKIVFDQLTEDAVKLMENGEYDVYHEKQEVFQREAEGYEKLAWVKEGMSPNTGEGNPYLSGEKDLRSGNTDSSVFSATLPSTALSTSDPNVSVAAPSSNGVDDYDMFADDDEDATAKPSVSENNAVSQPSTDTLNSDAEGVALQNDYVYDEPSGYYYNSSVGYYYDPNTGLYCSAVSGQWYSYNEETGTYDEVNQATANTT